MHTFIFWRLKCCGAKRGGIQKNICGGTGTQVPVPVAECFHPGYAKTYLRVIRAVCGRCVCVARGYPGYLGCNFKK